MNTYPKNKIQCTITKQWFGITPDRLVKLLNNPGINNDEDILRSTYICQAARTGIKQGLTIDDICKNILKGKTISRSGQSGKNRKVKAKLPSNKENIVETIFNPPANIKKNIDAEILEFLGI
jgi:hypothetical protein